MKIQSQIHISNDELFIGRVDEEIIKEKLVTLLIKEMCNSNFIKLTKENKLHGVEYSAEVFVSNIKYPEKFVEKNGAFVKDQLFSKEEVEEAILNTFPERFI